MTRKIAVINESAVCKDADVEAWTRAVQEQVTQHFAPLWGTSATLEFVAQGGKPVPTAWQMAILDDSDQASALGYHDLIPPCIDIDL